MKSLALLVVLLIGVLFGFVMLSGSVHTEENESAWDLNAELEMESQAERSGWGGPG
jgi:hypothetical protein